MNSNTNMFNNQLTTPSSNFFNNFNTNSNNTSNTKSNTSINQVTMAKNKENSGNSGNSGNIETQLFNLLNNKKARSNTDIGNQGNANMKLNNVNSNQSNNSDKLNNFFNNYKAYTTRDSYISQPSQHSVSPVVDNEFNEDELQKLSERHEKLINKILIEEESYIENHRKHVDEMVEIMKEVETIVNYIFDIFLFNFLIFIGNEQYQYSREDWQQH